MTGDSGFETVASTTSSTSGVVDIGALLAEHPVVDGHNDLLWTLRSICGDDFDAVDVSVRQDGRTHTDLPRLREGGVGAQFWSVYVPSSLGDLAVAATLEQVDAAHVMVERYPDRLVLATTADEVEAAWASGRIASLIGAEGGHQMGGSLAVLRMFHRLGVRYLTLTHNENTFWADSATDEPVLGGLSDFGGEVVAEMNRIGMMVDLSHVSAAVMRQAIEVSTAPVIFSHSSARSVRSPAQRARRRAERDGRRGRGLHGHLRAAVRDAGRAGVGPGGRGGGRPGGHRRQGPGRFDPFMARREIEHPPPPSTLADVVAHVEHVRDVAGVDHVGLGGDYDGVGWLPEGLEDVTGYPRLLAALADRHWSADDLAKLTCRNVAANPARPSRTGGGAAPHTSTITLVDLMTAVACLPTSRPSSSAASRLISDTTR